MSVALYSFWLSSSAYRVRIALHWKRIPFEYRAVSLAKGAHHDGAYVGLNPMKSVPTLVVGNTTLTQSTGALWPVKIGGSLALDWPHNAGQP